MASPISAMSAAVVGFEVVVGGGTSEKCIFFVVVFIGKERFSFSIFIVICF